MIQGFRPVYRSTVPTTLVQYQKASLIAGTDYFRLQANNCKKHPQGDQDCGGQPSCDQLPIMRGHEKRSTLQRHEAGYRFLMLDRQTDDVCQTTMPICTS